MVEPWTSRLPWGGMRTYGGFPRIGYWDGERFVVTWRGRTYRVARLVCEAFNGSAPFDGAVCMHIDEDSRNNSPTNLKWGTQKQNLNAPGFIAYCRSRTGENNPHRKGLASDKAST